MQVATCQDNQPWACSVYFVFDDDLSLYWISKPTTRHSKEIEVNPRVAGAIVLPHSQGDPVRGLQFQGIASKINDTNKLITALKLYSQRFELSDNRTQSILDNTDGHNVYAVTPSLFVLFDTKNFPHDPRQKFPLST